MISLFFFVKGSILIALHFSHFHDTRIRGLSIDGFVIGFLLCDVSLAIFVALYMKIGGIAIISILSRVSTRVVVLRVCVCVWCEKAQSERTEVSVRWMDV